MTNFMNIADLDSGNGKTYRELNNEKTHAFEIGQLVEIDNGVRLFVGELRRDCDGTPLYSLTLDGEKLFHGYPEYCLTLIKQKS